jgi:hypothetical protein
MTHEECIAGGRVSANVISLATMELYGHGIILRIEPILCLPVVVRFDTGIVAAFYPGELEPERTTP